MVVGVGGQGGWRALNRPLLISQQIRLTFRVFMRKNKACKD